MLRDTRRQIELPMTELKSGGRSLYWTSPMLSVTCSDQSPSLSCDACRNVDVSNVIRISRLSSLR